MTLTPSYDEIHAACVDFTHSFQQRGWEFDLVVGVARGGLIPAVILSHLLDTPLLPIDYSSRDGRGDDKDHSNLLPSISADTRILVVDDICDTGHTLREIVDHYTVQHVVCTTAVLFYKQHTATQHVIEPSIAWQTIPPDAGWVVFPFEKQSNHEL
jgi:hypoxanthine phosphoribosyltransferase